MSIKNLLKSNKVLYLIYFYVFSIIFKIFSFLIPKNKHLILFVVYGGSRYDDSPKIFYEYLLKTGKYKEYKMIWAFEECDKFPDSLNKVKINSLKYFWITFRAKYWITNASVERGLMYKTSQIYVNFQHGTVGIKLLGKSLPKENKSHHFKKAEKFDAIFVQGKNDIKWLSRDWDIEESKFFLTGLPRSIELFSYTQDHIAELKKRYHINSTKKVILYAPTFREYNLSEQKNVIYDNPFNIKAMAGELGNDFVLIMTSHYAVSEYGKLENDEFVYDLREPENFNDLIIMSDVIVTDYSSVAFDGFAAAKPVLCFAYDYDVYMKSRGGTYMDMNKLFNHGVIYTQEKLIEVIKKLDWEREIAFSKTQAEKYLFLNRNVNIDCEKIIFNELR